MTRSSDSSTNISSGMQLTLANSSYASCRSFHALLTIRSISGGATLGTASTAGFADPLSPPPCSTSSAASLGGHNIKTYAIPFPDLSDRERFLAQNLTREQVTVPGASSARKIIEMAK
eukprot:582124-Rhodomonas_salina.1